MSVFIQLLPGEYDAILKWPFQEKIVFTLYDQQEHIVKRKNFVYELTPNLVPVSGLKTLRSGALKALGCSKRFEFSTRSV